MIEFRLAYCYGIIVSCDVIDEKFKTVLSDDEFDEFNDNYCRWVNGWTGEDCFIGIANYLSDSDIDFVYEISDFTPPTEDDEDLIDLKRFFDEHNLWNLISWEPKMYLINFCF